MELRRRVTSESLAALQVVIHLDSVGAAVLTDAVGTLVAAAIACLSLDQRVVQLRRRIDLRLLVDVNIDLVEVLRDEGVALGLLFGLVVPIA